MFGSNVRKKMSARGRRRNSERPGQDERDESSCRRGIDGNRNNLHFEFSFNVKLCCVVVLYLESHPDW